MIRYLLFDFDGTLVNTADDIVDALHYALKKNNLPQLTREEIIASIGEGFKGLLKNHAPDLKENTPLFQSLRADFLFYYEKHMDQKAQLYPGVQQFLNQCSLHMGILSNKAQKHIPPLLQKFHLHTLPWKCLIGGDTYQFAKPHPLPLQEALKLAPATPQETLLVGDGIYDAQVAQTLGVHFLAVDYGYSTKAELKKEGAQHFISHFDELKEHIEALNASC